ncbi:hypothetical protein NEHOM01_2263 [Nematocida homosporus]|uniref:uncharacterized protein n=1 Tax=Nematocida homosporus TaxID=1912981 RepID=UPI00221F359E|nr:uncharacterized protein NEHOM01_2263 [Nematocida homosporus]KAI5187548.1 hypothetical protein NEHOM01_2263 [Nematocida homosporus]
MNTLSDTNIKSDAKSTSTIDLDIQPTPTTDLTSRKRIVLLCRFVAIYFFVHILIYSSHNFRETIGKEIFGLTSAQYSLVEMTSAVKLIGAVGGTWVCQKGLRPLYIAGLACLVFVTALSLLIMQVTTQAFVNLLLGMTIIMSESAILPTIDAECLSVLAKYDLRGKFGIVRMFSTIGHAMAYPLNYSIQRFVLRQTTIATSVLVNSMIFGIISIMTIMVAIGTVERVKIEKKASSSSQEESKYSFTSFSPTFILLIICSLGSGLSRSSLQTYLTEYLLTLRSKSPNDGFVSFVYFFRTLCELFVWWIVIWLGNKACLELLFPLAILLGATRSLLYSIDLSRHSALSLIPYLAEFLKSTYSALFIYVSVQLAYKYSPKDQKTLAQGIFTGAYSAFAAFVAGVIGYIVFSTSSLSGIATRQRLFGIVGWLGVLSALLASTIYFKHRAKPSS